MSKKPYSWQRYWISRSEVLTLDWDGYLPDPTSEWGRTRNSTLVTLNKTAEFPCLVLLGEAGMGKTTALKSAHQQICEQIQSSENVCLPLFRLGDYNTDTELCNAVFRSSKFQEWLSGEHKLYIFLDSLDEGLLSIKVLARILKREIESLPCDRLYLRITCRSTEWAPSLEEKMKEKWGVDKVGIYMLTPLTRSNVVEAASHINADHFLEEISSRNVVPLATKPITLQFLIDLYVKEEKLPSSQVKLYELGCLELCKEVNRDRLEADYTGNFSATKRRMIAGRIAAVMIFCNRSSIWMGLESDAPSDSDVLLQDLCVDQEKVEGQEFDIDQSSIKEVFEITGLFSAKGNNQRIEFTHRTYAEFLAAWYVKQRQLQLQQILQLIIHSGEPDGKVISQLYETVAWLSSMLPEVFQRVVQTDPDVLLRSDIQSATDTERKDLVRNLLRLCDEHKLVSDALNNYRNYGKLKHQDLLEQLKSYICDSTKSSNARCLAIDIAEGCCLKDASPSLVKLALAANEPYLIRSRAASFVLHIGDEADKVGLKDLYLIPQDDPEDDLKGYGLKATYPKHITTEEVLNGLTRPQANYFGGCYQEFIAHDIGEHMPESDLSIALGWVYKQPISNDLNYPFDALANSIMLRAWEHLDDPRILETFAEIVVAKQSQHVEVIDTYGSKTFKDMLQGNDNKRRALIEKCISIIQGSPSNVDWLFEDSGCGSLSILKQDFSWLIDNLKTSSQANIQGIYAALVHQQIDRKDAGQVNAVITVAKDNTQASSVLKSVFKKWFPFNLDHIHLDSEEAENLKSGYLEEQNRQAKIKSRNKLEPPPKTRVLQCLDKFESGQISAWSDLCREMTSHYGQPCQVDIMALPGWKESDESVQHRIIEAAKQYIYEGEPNTKHWLGSNSFPYTVVSGYQAIRFISVQEPDFISSLPAEIWRRWTAIILDFPNADTDKSKDVRENLLRSSCHKAPDEFFRVLEVLFDLENSRNRIFTYRKLACCWNERIANFLLAKAKDKSTTPRNLEKLLEILVEYEYSKAVDLAKSFVAFPLPKAKESREKVAIAIKRLLLSSDEDVWPSMWGIIQENPDFGKEVLEDVSFQLECNGAIGKHIEAECLADIYIFLSKQYLDSNSENQVISNKKEISGPKAYAVGPEDRIRMWRNRLPQRLQELGTPEACQALQRIIDELPALKGKLQWRLLEAQTLSRRKNWQPPMPEEFLKLVVKQEPSNSEVVETITRKMEDEPKIRNEVNFLNSPNSSINAPIGTSGTTNNQVAISDSHNNQVAISDSQAKNRINWEIWLSVAAFIVAIIAIPLSMTVSGAFNEEFRGWWNRTFSSEVEQQPTPDSQ